VSDRGRAVAMYEVAVNERANRRKSGGGNVRQFQR